MMHACESGLIKYINKIFVASMSLSVQVQVDLLIEKTFVGNRSPAKIVSPERNSVEALAASQCYHPITGQE
jgi:hypothetical protein